MDELLRIIDAEIQDGLPRSAIGWTHINSGIWGQDEQLIREQFDNISRDPREITFYRTLLNDQLRNDTASLDSGDSQPLRWLYATDLPAVDWFFICS